MACTRCGYSGADNCQECNETAGYIFKSPSKCVPRNCAEGFFLNLTSLVCQSCLENCKTCTGSANCTECLKGYSLSDNSTKCSSCISRTGLTSKPGSDVCVEICGDGIDLGMLGCDDGNTVDGDGCSSNCEVEPGFTCQKPAEGPNVCYTTVPPSPSLKISGSKNEHVTLSFSRTIVSAAGTLIPTIELSLLHVAKDCVLKYAFRVPKAKSNFTQLVADLTIECSVSSTAKLKATFRSPGLFVDENRIGMTETAVTVCLNKASWIDPNSAQLVASAGSGFNSANVVVMCASLGQYLLQSVALGSLWALVNMAQLIYYTPVFSTQIPANLNMFIANYLTVAQIQIPSSLNFVSLPTEWLDQLQSSLIDGNLKDFGLSSLSFLYNFYQQLFTWLALLCCYLCLVALDRLRPKGRFLFIQEWKQDYVFNGVIRVLIECFIDLSFYSILNISYLDTSNPLSTISCYLSGVGLLLAIGFFVWCTVTVSQPRAEYASKSFVQHYSSLTEEFKANAGPFRRGYYVVFMLRRALFALVLVSMSAMVKTQLGIAIVLDLVMLTYIGMLRPFESRVDNYLNFFNEGVVLFTHCSLLVINMFNLDGSPAGWACIGLIVVSAGQSWAIMVKLMAKPALDFVMRLCHPGQAVSAPANGGSSRKGKARAVLIQNFPSSPVVVATKWAKQQKCGVDEEEKKGEDDNIDNTKAGVAEEGEGTFRQRARREMAAEPASHSKPTLRVWCIRKWL